MDDKVAEAIDVVARQVVWRLIADADDEWGNFPEVGETDWWAVENRMDAIGDSLKPDRELYEAAYEFLEGRAEHDGAANP